MDQRLPIMKIMRAGSYFNKAISDQQPKTISNNKEKIDQYDQDLICMIEGCNAMGEEVVAVLSEGSSPSDNVYEYNEHHHSNSNNTDDLPPQRSNFDNEERANDNVSNTNLIPVLVCDKHFGKLMKAYYCK